MPTISPVTWKVTNLQLAGSITGATTGAFSGAVTVTGADLLVRGTAASIPLYQLEDTTNNKTINLEISRTVAGTFGIYSSDGEEIFTLSRLGALALPGTLAVTGAVTLSSTLGIKTVAAPLGDLDIRHTAGRHFVAKYVDNITLSAESDTGEPESLRVYADTFRVFTSTAAAGLTERMRVSSDGQVLIGTTVTTGASAGDLVLAKDKNIMGVDTAGTGAGRIVKAEYNSDFGHIAGLAWTRIQNATTAGYPTGSAANNGVLGIDTTTPALIFYANGARYRINGTAF